MLLSTGKGLLASEAIWLASVKESGGEGEWIFASKSGATLSAGISSEKSDSDWLVISVGEDKADPMPESESELMGRSSGSRTTERFSDLLSLHWARSVCVSPWLHVPVSHDLALASLSTVVSPSVGAGLVVIGLSLSESEQLSLFVKWATGTALDTGL